MNYLVVPSVREKNLNEFLNAWSPLPDNITLIIVEDNSTKTFNLNIEHHYSWAEIDAYLGENAWIISRKDAAIRSFGFLIAYLSGADFIFTLDDDCLPEPGETFYETHLSKLKKITKWSPLIPGMRTRGLPYENLGEQDNVVANFGLWTGVPDIDAISSLANGIPTDFRPPENIDQVLAYGRYYPLCGMNLAFKRQVTPLAYFCLMGNGTQFGRFEDIWFGIILKKICDHLGLLISAGHPFIHHSRASNAFKNLTKEAPGIGYNEFFWEMVDKVNLKGSSPKECMAEIGEALMAYDDDYARTLGKAIVIWSSLF